MIAIIKNKTTARITIVYNIRNKSTIDSCTKKFIVNGRKLWVGGIKFNCFIETFDYIHFVTFLQRY